MRWAFPDVIADDVVSDLEATERGRTTQKVVDRAMHVITFFEEAEKIYSEEKETLGQMRGRN